MSDGWQRTSPYWLCLTSDICLMQPALKQCLASVVQVSLTSSLISISYSLSVVCLKTNQMVWNVRAALSSVRLLGKGVFGRKTGQKGGRSLWWWRWSNGCCFISEQAGTDNSGERWFIDHSHCHGMSKLAHGGDMNKWEGKERQEEKTCVAIQEETGANFLEKNIAAVLHVCVSHLIYSVSSYHSVCLIRSYCTLVSFWRLARGKIGCLCDPFKRLLA